MVTSTLKTILWCSAGAISLTIGTVAGKYSLPYTVSINNRIENLAKKEKRSGKIFKSLEHIWNKNEHTSPTPFVLFKCVYNKDADSCSEIDAFTSIVFKYGQSPFLTLFKCVSLNSNTYTPLYYFDQELKDDATPLDLDWSKLTRGKAEKRKWGKYIVIHLSTTGSCGGKIEEYKWTANSNFWTSYFMINKEWTPKYETEKDISVFFKKSDETEKQYWWKPIAALNYDFDPDSIKNELKKYMPKK